MVIPPLVNRNEPLAQSLGFVQTVLSVYLSVRLRSQFLLPLGVNCTTEMCQTNFKATSRRHAQSFSVNEPLRMVSNERCPGNNWNSTESESEYSPVFDVTQILLKTPTQVVQMSFFSKNGTKRLWWRRTELLTAKWRSLLAAWIKVSFSWKLSTFWFRNLLAGNDVTIIKGRFCQWREYVLYFRTKINSAYLLKCNLCCFSCFDVNVKG